MDGCCQGQTSPVLEYAVKKFKSHCGLISSLQPSREDWERVINENRDCDEMEVSTSWLDFDS